MLLVGQPLLLFVPLFRPLPMKLLLQGQWKKEEQEKKCKQKQRPQHQQLDQQQQQLDETREKYFRLSRPSLNSGDLLHFLILSFL